MAVKPIVVNREKGFGESLVSMIPGMVGSYYGGPAGGAVGGQIGQGMTKDPSQPVAERSQQPESDMSQIAGDPRSRRQQSIEESPTYTLRKGQESLSTMDPETQKTLAPVLQEALKRDAEERKRQQSVSTSY